MQLRGSRKPEQLALRREVLVFSAFPKFWVRLKPFVETSTVHNIAAIFFWTMTQRRWKQKAAFTPVKSFLPLDELGGDAPLWSASVVSEHFVMHSGCREDLRSRPLVPTFHLLSGRVKGKATGMMKHPTLIVFKGRLYVFTFHFNSERRGKL